MRNYWKRFFSMVLVAALLIGIMPVYPLRAEAAQESGISDFAGKTISILGDSISTYRGISNNTSYNSTIGKNAVYYAPGTLGVYQADTWWQQVIDALGMELLVNNSWSGSCVLHTRSGTVGAYVDRCVQLHDNAGNAPDVIAVFLGTNDFSYYQDTLGTADAIAYDSLIRDNGDGTYTYAEPATTCEAYAIMLHKMTERYPDAEIYCMTLTARRDPDYTGDDKADVGQPTAFNAELAEIIEHFGCTVVDLENCGIGAASEVFDVYMGDKRVHPNAQGMDLISKAVISAMLGEDTDLYDISFDLTNVTGDGAHAVLPGDAYTVTLTEAEGFRDMSVTITMGGEDVTASCYADGVVSIPAVTGDVLITAESMERDPLNFRWEFDGNKLASVTDDGNTENTLTKLAGSVTDGVFSSTRYQMERTVMLLHDRSWVLEWKGTGKGGVMLAADSVATTGDPFFFRRQASQMFAFGAYEGSQYNNYGITLPDTIDTTTEHIYRLENQIADDGSNMVWLYVDDVEIGALNQYFVGGTAQGTTSDWISGQDFLFNYIGTTSHPLTDMSVEYLQIEEDSSVHYHSYTAVVTPPTYTEGGYTTYTCTGCGDSYVGDYTDAITFYSYRWEMVNNALESVTSNGNTANSLTLNSGSVTDGTFSSAQYTLEKNVRLYHDVPWVMEWKASGDWSAMLLTSTARRATEDMTFIFRTFNATGLLALGTYSGGSYHNYGIALADYGLDMTVAHTYRLENRIADDGSNMVYLIVDGTELGAMNNYYIGGTNNQNQTVDWVNGRDFSFGFMGSTSHPLKDMELEYFQVWEGGEPETPKGKTISILGASISTYAGISNNAEYNSTIGGNAVYYTAGRYGVYANDTWWMQAANDLDLRLLVNNAWSGSSLLYERSGTVGAYVDRCVQLHDDTGDNAGEEPDIIGIQLGTNDYQYYKDTLGSANIDYEALITDNGDGSYTYAKPTTSLEAVAIVLHKISIRYPNAEVYYLNLSQRVDITDETAGILEQFNENLAAVCGHFGVTIVDIYNSGITQDNFDSYIGDGRVHPNQFGMDAYTEAFKKAFLGNHAELTAYTVDFQLDNVTADYGVDKQVLAGKSFTCTLTAPEYFRPQVTVTMDGVDITDSCYADGIVTIEEVTGSVVITAETVLDHEPVNYRWEFDGSELASVNTDGNIENPLTKLAGSTTDGVFTSTNYSLDKTVVLSHELPWSVEWKSEGTWRNSSTSGGRLFSSASTSSTDTQYIFKSVNSYLIAMGNRTSSGSYNYGIALSDYDIDGSALHIYRLENRIAEDGSNMIWLYVDGVEIGPMNNLYMGTTDQNTTSDWLSGQDFLFPYIGTATHGLNNCSLDYVQVWEGGANHYHTYTAEVTPSTYKEGGYTTYTCTGCGDSYVADHTDPIVLHAYRWELQEDALVSVEVDGGTDNTLTQEHGSITDGTFTNVLYSTDSSIHLYHDQPWVIEWKASGDCARTAGSTSGGSALLSSNTVLKSDEGTWFLYKRPSNYLIALCYRDKTTSIQSGIALADHGIDGSALHTYRLENRVEDGSNMVYLIVDGTELGAMNNLFVSAVDQGETTDFLNGLDWTFDYMGVTNYYLNNCSIEYMQIWEAGANHYHTHTYASVTTSPTCTEQGYTTHTCECGDSYVDSYVEALGHSYSGTTCTLCGEEHPEVADYSGKVISILGASTCTFDGYIPVADGFNLKHYARYPQDNLLTDVNDTWWMQVINDLDAKLGINDSWRSTEVYNACTDEVNSSYDGTKACLSSVTRIQNLGSNGTPDVILFFGGTNDITQRRPLGTFDPTTAPTEVDLTSETWTTVVDAYTALIMRVQYYYPDAEFVVLLPYSTASNSDAVTEKYTSVFAEICGYYGVTCINLNDCGISVSDLPDGTHPDAEGMDYITKAVLDTLLSECDMEPGENIVHSVKHEMTGAESSLGYYKGVSEGKSFVTTLTGDDLTVTVTMGGVDITNSCYADGVVNIPNVNGDLVIMAKGAYNADGHLQQLPESFCAGTNLWTVLAPENTYYTTSGWGNNSNSNYSVTFPVTAGDRIWATSFGAAGTNGYSANAVRITWFGENGVLESLGRNVVYAEFAEYGYITVPEGAVAVNIPMASNDSSWEIYILNRDHVYENGVCAACGVEHPNLANLEGKVISIMGDSISTFAGYIPVADGYNREHLARYPQEDLLTDVNETWWMQVINDLDAKLGINESWRGSTLSGAVPVTTGDTGENAAMSNLIRIQNMGSNGTPDVILLYGGTNDLAHVSKVGTFDPATAPTEVDLTTTRWDNLADGFVHTLLRMRYFYPDAMIVAMLPTYTASYYSDEKLAQGNEVMTQICEHYGIPYVDLRYCGISTDDLPDGIHPDATGMDYISAYVLEFLLNECDMVPGENIVYPVTHELTNVKASLGHYKGVSQGKPFEETLDGEDMTVSVTMGGVDITAECYADGKITIAEVTGTLVITAEGTYSLKDHLQPLPDPYCGVNLWQVLAHDAEYYSADGWATHSSGQVKSITFPVNPGERLYASSFEAAGANGGSMDGIRVTYFAEDGVLVSMTAAQVYSEFSKNGCLTVPEGAVAVSIPMWTDSSDWDVHFLCILDGHLQQIPEGSYNDTNLWPLMEHDAEYYSADGWAAHRSGSVMSVTIPVVAGDRLYASSFGAAGTNGAASNGIRVTYFTQCGVLVSLTSNQVYSEFGKYGYLTVPEGAVAVCIPMWTDSEDWELYILNLPDAPPELKDFTYTLNEDDGTVTLTEYTGAEAGVTVEPEYMVDGKVYATVLDSASVFRGNTSITSVKIEAGVAFKDNSMAYLFSECKKLVAVDMTGVDTSAVTDMSYLFDWCSALTTIIGYENWNTGAVQSIYKAFNRTSSLTKIDLSAWDLSWVINSGWCFQLCMASEILLPDNLLVMSAGFLNHATNYAGTTFTVPAGVLKVGYAHTIYDFATNDFVEFKVAEGNTEYVAIDGILYSADGTEMLAIPRNKTFEDGIYEIPEGVTFLGELSFSRNYNIHTVVLPNSLVIRNVLVYDPQYILYQDVGNLNAGNSLSIAIYCYTGITDYAVKDDNPNYASVDGILYSKNMTRVVAVPSRYNKYMDIPEGVTQWITEAMWADNSSTVDNLMANCTGVSIPASLTDIAQDQIDKLNRLNDRFDTFEITVSPKNPVYCVDGEGNLVVHSFTDTVTAPTCTEQGYTTRTCVCGYSCVENMTDATGHIYQEMDGQWVCHCGDIEKNGVVEENGSLFYYEHGKLTYAGLIYLDGYYYYVRSNGELVRNRSYWITKNNGLMESAAYEFDDQGRMILEEEPEVTEPSTPDETTPDDTEPEVKNGIVAENGSLYYYRDGKLYYAGLIYLDGYYYYVRGTGELVRNCSYWITKNNGLMESAAYEFDDQGRMILREEPEATEPTAPETEPVDPTVKNGIVVENGGLFYYQNGKLYYAGLIYLDGYYYYVRGTGELVVGCSYWVTKNNGLMESAAYEFDDQGRMILDEDAPETEPTTPTDPDLKNGIVAENGSLYYYVDGKLNYAGLIYLDGYYYYVKGSGELVVGRSYWITKNNGLMESAMYTFDSDGKMIDPPATE